MIFLAVGNWQGGFDRLIKAVDEFKAGGIINEAVIAQAGQGRYRPSNFEVVDYCSPDEFESFISKSNLVISHAGVGVIVQTIKQGKPIIVVPRKASLGEHVDDHQFATARQLEAEGKILVAYDVSELPAKLEQAKTFVPVRGGGPEKILQAVQQYIDAVAAKKRRWLR